MSEEAIRDLTASIQALTLSTDSLTRVVQQLVDQRENSDSDQGSESQFSIAAASPLPPDQVVPRHLLLNCIEKLSNKHPGPDVRAQSAYASGVRAHSALVSGHQYVGRSPIKSLSTNHWIVLRSSRGEPFRTTSRRDFVRLCDSRDPHLIVEKFNSLTEAEVFCEGAHHTLPPLRGC